MCGTPVYKSPVRHRGQCVGVSLSSRDWSTMFWDHVQWLLTKGSTDPQGEILASERQAFVSRPQIPEALRNEMEVRRVGRVGLVQPCLVLHPWAFGHLLHGLLEKALFFGHGGSQPRILQDAEISLQLVRAVAARRTSRTCARSCSNRSRRDIGLKLYMKKPTSQQVNQDNRQTVCVLRSWHGG